MRKLMRSLPAGAVALLAGAAAGGLRAAADEPEAQKVRVDWESWHADNEVSDIASLQRGARNFMNYCQGCHSLKYMRYQRMADGSEDPEPACWKANLVPPGRERAGLHRRPADAGGRRAELVRQGAARPVADRALRAAATTSIGTCKTFYADPASPTGSNNLALPARRCRTCCRISRASRGGVPAP